MPPHPPVAPGEILRHFTVAVFVVHRGCVLLHYHRKLGKWLQLGGHADGDPDVRGAALREAREESGLASLRLLMDGI